MRRKNRKLARPWRARLVPPRELWRMCRGGLRAAAPALIAVTLAGGIGAGGYVGYHWLTQSERFAVEEIELSGGERIDVPRVREILGMDGDDNIFGLGLGQLEHTLELDPWIAEARVARRLPDTLVIEIREEEPAALVELDGLYLADHDGRVFKRADLEAGEGAGLPIITGVARDAYLRAPDGARTQIREALDALALYRAMPARPEVSEIHLDARRGIVLHTHDSAMAIRLGDGDRATLSRRLSTFDAAWSALTDDERDTARVVYLDNETRPDRVTVGFDRTRARHTDG